MKRSISAIRNLRTFIFLTALMCALPANSNTETNDPLLNIQDRIYNAFITGMMTQEDTDLNGIRSELEDLYKKSNNSLILYWTAYTDYYRTILYLKAGNETLAQKTINDGINIIKGIKSKTSDDYALLSLMQGLQIQFAGMEAASLSADMMKNVSLALELDPENIRANYVYGIVDYFTPQAYGGGQAAEKYFLKAISLPAQKIPSKYHPSWGKEEAYEYLVRLYLRQGRMDKAEEYCSEGLQLFPTSYMLKSLDNQIRN